MAEKRRRRRSAAAEFRPDVQRGHWLKTLRLTQQQRLRLLKWGAYILTMLLALVTQDVLMSRLNFMGATTDLAVCVILLITVAEGTEVGSLFVLIASTVYFYTGSAPGAYCIGLMSFFGIGATMTRQMYWRRDRSAMVLCAGAAQMAYSLGLFAAGIFQGLTRWDRLGIFLLSGALNVLVMIPLYPLICKIGTIGGTTWKE